MDKLNRKGGNNPIIKTTIDLGLEEFYEDEPQDDFEQIRFDYRRPKEDNHKGEE